MCGSVGRASDSRPEGHRFKSGHVQIFYSIFIIFLSTRIEHLLLNQNSLFSNTPWHNQDQNRALGAIPKRFHIKIYSFSMGLVCTQQIGTTTNSFIHTDVYVYLLSTDVASIHTTWLVKLINLKTRYAQHIDQLHALHPTYCSKQTFSPNSHVVQLYVWYFLQIIIQCTCISVGRASHIAKVCSLCAQRKFPTNLPSPGIFDLIDQ